jgi:hypothetical protein
MGTVTKFPKAKRPALALDLDTEKLKASMPKASTVKSVFAWLWFAVRMPVFLVLYWLRLPVLFVCGLVSFPMLLAWIFAWYAFPDKTEMVWGFAIVSFVAFAVSWVYDFVLMALSPQEMMRTL